MKLKNETRYDSRLLRTVISLAHREIAKTEGRLRQWAWVTFKVRRRITTKHTALDGTAWIGNNHTSGHAYVGGTKAVLTIPCPGVRTSALYSLAWHEMFHLYGYHHRGMGGACRGAMHPTDIEMARVLAGLPATMAEKVPVKVPRAERAAGQRAERMTNAEAKVIEWSRKVKTANTKLRKWRRAVARYKKAEQYKIAAMQQPAPPTEEAP